MISNEKFSKFQCNNRIYTHDDSKLPAKRILLSNYWLSRIISLAAPKLRRAGARQVQRVRWNPAPRSTKITQLKNTYFD